MTGNLKYWSDVLTIKNGKNQKKVENPEGRYPIYGSGGIMGYADDFICEANTTIIGRKGSINNPIYVEEPFWNVDTAFGLCSKDDLDSKYLFYFCKQYNFLIHNKATTLPSLTKADLLKIKIPLPPLKTQIQIAKILDDAAALRDKTAQLLEEYDLLAQSIFLDMFGDPISPSSKFNRIPLKDITDISSGSTPSRKIENNFNGHIPWVKTGEVNSTVIMDTEEKISDLGLKNSSCKIYDKGSIIIAMYGQGKTRGQVGLLGIPAATNQACAVLPPTEKMNFIYLYEYLKLVYNDLRSLGRGGNQPNLNAGLLKNYKVLNPSIKLQNQFAEKITLIEQQKELAKQELKESEDLFNCLLQKAFKGELIQV